MGCRPNWLAVSVIAFAVATGAPRVAHATDSATAQALFDQGRKLMAQERWAEACPKLEESQRLDPAGGTLLHLALCREHEGRIATAWALYQDALAQANHDGRKDRAKIAQEHVDSLAPRLPRMLLRIPPGDRRAEGFTLTRDDVTVGEAQWGEALPVDPGAHVLTAKATGRRPWSQTIEIPSRPQQVTLEIPELELDVQSDGPKAGDGSRVAPEPVRDSGPPRHDDAHAGDGQRTIAIVAAGVGVAGLLLGATFGLVSISKNSDADKECAPPDHTSCTSKGVDDGSSAKTAGNVSTVAFIAGGALVAGGVALYFTAPRGSTVAIVPTAAPRAASLSLTARF
jgi:hypothetical protein